MDLKQYRGAQPSLDNLGARLASLAAVTHLGRVTRIGATGIGVAGLQRRASVGDRIILPTGGSAEIVELDADRMTALPADGVAGLRVGMEVRLVPRPILQPDDSWMGRVIDPDGRPIDGWPLFPGRPVSPAPEGERRGFGARLETGSALFNTLLPVVRGQRIGLFAGSGVGKSTLLAHFARAMEADVVVLALVGERSRELRDFVQDILGEDGLRRSVVVAATGERSAASRAQCARTAADVARHFRDSGRQVLLLMDSLTRFAEAHREVAVQAGEPATLRGFPASTGPALARLCEAAGPGPTGAGDITAIYTVLVAGSDMDEPVADMVRGLLDGHVVLDRGIAERGRFPAVNVLQSVSRSLPGAASEAENRIIAEARCSMAAFDRIELMRQAGLYVTGADPEADAAVACHDALETFLTHQDGRAATAHFAALRQVLNHGQAVRQPPEEG